VAFFGWRTFDNNDIATSDIVVVRDDNGAMDDNGAINKHSFRDLRGTDSIPGKIVEKDVKIPWRNSPTLGFERIGSTLSIAVHPNNSDIVYIAWADRVGNEIYTIHVRRSINRGKDWSNDLRTIKDATCVSLAVADNGTLGLLYQQFKGNRWITHLEIINQDSNNNEVEDIILANVPGDEPVRQFLPYIGDYNFLLSIENEFRGIFSANNTPNNSNFPNKVIFQSTL